MSQSAGAEPRSNILTVTGLKKYFPIQKGFFRTVVGHTKAVDGVDFSVGKGETVGMVGESGSGKTTIGRCIVRLYEPTQGRIEFHSGESTVDLSSVKKRNMQPIRRKIQMLFQDPYSSLNPRMNVGEIVSEPLVIHRLGTKGEQRDRTRDLLQLVGLNPDDVNKFPHQFSGGQRQRIGIARALSLNPELIVCDEPVSALDVSIQAQVLNLLADLQEELDLSYLFIAHDLSVVEYISDRVIVIYLGRIMEIAGSDVIYASPQHPYTEALLASISKFEAGRSRRVILEGNIPDPANPPRGCVFHTRCRYVQDKCREEVPRLTSVPGSAQGYVACRRHGEIELSGYSSS
jgi:oligopeptide/dipeptide ABC transporter ATP-binding protein